MRKVQPKMKKANCTEEEESKTIIIDTKSEDEKTAAQDEQLAQSLLASLFGGGYKPSSQYRHQPEIKSAEQAAQSMIGCKRIMMLTGAGISAASGIPTFRGNDGFWKDAKQYAGETSPYQVLTKQFFQENPMAVWEWHYDFIKLARGTQVNEGHRAIAKFQEYCYSQQQKQLQCMLVTQNIDDLHTRVIKQSQILRQNPDPFCQLTESNLQAFTPHIYEIHGNVHYMHCSDESQSHSLDYFPTPSLEEFDEAAAQASNELQTESSSNQQNFCLVPTCQLCDKPMKPHCMFFDEAYNEHYYRKDSVNRFLKISDCLIVVGTALATNFAKRIVAEHLERELPVIEINLETAIGRGHNIQVLERSEIALPKLFSEYYRLQKTGSQIGLKVNQTPKNNQNTQSIKNSKTGIQQKSQTKMPSVAAASNQTKLQKKTLTNTKNQSSVQNYRVNDEEITQGQEDNAQNNNEIQPKINSMVEETKVNQSTEEQNNSIFSPEEESKFAEFRRIINRNSEQREMLEQWNKKIDDTHVRFTNVMSQLMNYYKR